MSSLFSELQWRGLVFDATRDTERFLEQENSPLGYVGFDPTASSLHIGSLVPLMALMHLQRSGGRPVAIMGGGTGMVGDPSGRTSERTFMSPDEIETNLEGIRAQIGRFLDLSGPRAALVLNNLDWLGRLSFLGFLRDVGKYYTVNQMLSKESVKIRLDRAREGGEGISYTEFTYMLMQAYDFLHLHDELGCRFQMGGSDQWGNITAGIDLIGRLRNRQAFGLVLPLVTMASGEKFGKSVEGTVWLDAHRTSPYRFYQYWINTDDADLERYLKCFTLLTESEILAVVSLHQSSPQSRSGQTALARDITSRVHGEEGWTRALRASEALFGGSLQGLSSEELADVFADVPAVLLHELPDFFTPFAAVDLCVWSGLAGSKGEARRLIEGGGFYINNERVDDFKSPVEAGRRLHGRYLVLRKGQKNYTLVKWLS
jgi:tyrosyl-tRNA synthetase